jgi:plastocyanin
MPARTRPLLALALLALLAGCGGQPKIVRERATTFTVTLDDYLIRPQRLSVPGGRRLTVTVVNRGRLGHTFRLRSTNHTVLKLTTIAPGASKTSRPFKLAPGSYTMFCALANHEELGMSGTLIVRG